MSLKKAWVLVVGLLLVVGMVGCGEKPEPVVEPKPIPDPVVEPELIPEPVVEPKPIPKPVVEIQH
jgi:hypothetical protein